MWLACIRESYKYTDFIMNIMKYAKEYVHIIDFVIFA
jgi:hypothetical protein